MPRRSGGCRGFARFSISRATRHRPSTSRRKTMGERTSLLGPLDPGRPLTNSRSRGQPPGARRHRCFSRRSAATTSASESVRALPRNACKWRLPLPTLRTSGTRGHLRALAGVPLSREFACRAWLVQADPSCGDPLLGDRELDARCSAGLARPYRC